MTEQNEELLLNDIACIVMNRNGLSHLEAMEQAEDILAKAKPIIREMTLEEVGEYAIRERQKLKEKKVGQRQRKPDDIQTQIVIGSKMKALQQIIDKLEALKQGKLQLK